jgi:sterol desaturase/sphingolipid hydroxylase (fatty acid hydroxylase superfamily)
MGSMKERLIRFRSFWIFPLLSAALLWSTVPENRSRLGGQLFWSWTAGLILWTILEYFFHRVLLHTHVVNPTLQAFLNGQHMAHHAAPRDPSKILVKPLFGVFISAVIYGLLFWMTGSAFRSAGVITGIWTGFLYYELVHYRVHMSLTHSPLLQLQRRAHFYHHFSNSNECFGVTTPLWDYVFGTARTRH